MPSLLKSAYTNRLRRKESRTKGLSKVLIPTRVVVEDSVKEPPHILGYKSGQAKVIHLVYGNRSLEVGVRGIRAFWTYLYGLNPSGSPKGITTLLEHYKELNIDKSIRGWRLNVSGSMDYKALVIHRPRCIKLITNDVNGLMTVLKAFNPNDSNTWRISYKELSL